MARFRMARMTVLPTRLLGRTGLTVSTLGFGGAPLGDLYQLLDDDTALGAVATAVAAGVTLYDVAPLYGYGLAEHRLGTVLKRLPRDSFLVSTKVGRWLKPAPDGPRDRAGFRGGLSFDPVIDYSYDGTMRAFEQSLHRLGLPSVDIALIHDVDVWTHGKDLIEQRFREAMDGAYRALDELRRSGVVRAIGVGVNESAMCVRFANAGDIDVVLLAGRYSLLEQPALADFLPLAEQKGIGVMLGGVFNSGILATGAVAGAKYNYRAAPPEILDRVKRIETVCAAHGVALPVAAMAFALGHPAVASLVIGAVTPAEVTRNVEALTARVPASLWPDLKREGLLDPQAPTPA
jgi:D-threo-aldose 1-dehydrogenase